MIKKRLLWSGASVFGLLAGITLLSPIFTRSLCACVPMEINLRSAFGASPLNEPDLFRIRFLEKVPKTSTQEEIFHVLGATSGGRGYSSSLFKKDEFDRDYIDRMNERCVKEGNDVTCNFVAYKRWFEMNELGFNLKLIDVSNGYKDVVVTPYSKWW